MRQNKTDHIITIKYLELVRSRLLNTVNHFDVVIAYLKDDVKKPNSEPNVQGSVAADDAQSDAVG